MVGVTIVERNVLARAQSPDVFCGCVLEQKRLELRRPGDRSRNSLPGYVGNGHRPICAR